MNYMSERHLRGAEEGMGGLAFMRTGANVGYIRAA